MLLPKSGLPVLAVLLALALIYSAMAINIPPPPWWHPKPSKDPKHPKAQKDPKPPGGLLHCVSLDDACELNGEKNGERGNCCEEYNCYYDGEHTDEKTWCVVFRNKTV